MKYLMTAVALASLAVSPAFAAPAKHVTHRNAMESNASAQEPAAYSARDPYAVYVDGQLVGRDPDPNVRMQLEKDAASPNY